MSKSTAQKIQINAVNLKSHGEAELLKCSTVELPAPDSTELQIKMQAAGVNYIDIYQRTGKYGVPLPYTLGLEGAGTVEAVGSAVKEFKPGDRVAFVGAPGAYATHANVPVSKVMPLPDSMSFDQGAAYPLQGLTAQYLINEYKEIKPGMDVLIHAAAGGMGRLLCQWAKHLGANVFGTTSSEQKAEIAKASGCDQTINYTQECFAEKVLSLTGNKGVDLIIDGVGKSTFTKDLDAIKTRGTIVIFGSASGAAEPISANELQKKSIRVGGGSLFDHISNREELLSRAKEVTDAIESGWLKLNIPHKLPLEEAKEAHELLESRASHGKIVLTISH